MNKRNSVFVLIAIVILSGLVTLVLVFRKNPSTVEKASIDYYLEAGEFIDAFEEAEDQAMLKYGEKIIVVTGEIEEITSEQDRTIIMLRTESLGSISCLMGEETSSELQVGEHCQIKGRCSGYTIDVLLKQCIVETDGADPTL